MGGVYMKIILGLSLLIVTFAQANPNVPKKTIEDIARFQEQKKIFESHKKESQNSCHVPPSQWITPLKND